MSHVLTRKGSIVYSHYSFPDRDMSYLQMCPCLVAPTSRKTQELLEVSRNTSVGDAPPRLIRYNGEGAAVTYQAVMCTIFFVGAFY